MSRSDSRAVFAWWEYVVWVLVTVSLLLIGVVLWIFGLVFRLARSYGKRRADD